MARRKAVQNVAMALATVTFLFSAVLFLSFSLGHTPDEQFVMREGIFLTGLASVFLAVSASPTLLYVSSYAGTITTLNLTLPDGGDSLGTLEAISSTTGCAPSPAWLTLDRPNSVLYCMDEGLSTPNGSVSSFKTEEDGSLVQLDRREVISGPVSAVIYGKGLQGLALAHYSGSSFSSLSIADPAQLAISQSQVFTLAQPGPDPSRQDAPHPHEALLDPTGSFFLVPDLGADLVRVFKVDEGSLEWEALDPLVAAPGSGPRHATFLVTEDKTVMYLVGELANTITAYEVTYSSDSSLEFSELFAISTHGTGSSVPAGTTAAEIELSPDNKFLLVSSRGENSFEIPNFDPHNSTYISSDAIITFSVNSTSGDLTHVQTFASGGRIPRHFSINKAGDMLAVGLQADSRVVVIERNVESGCLERFLANATVAGEVTGVLFDE